MSCRVLKRGVEKMTCNYIVEQARAHGAKKVTGTYIPTEKNAMVKNLFPDLGFESLESAEDGTTKWVLDVDTYQMAEHQITITEEE